MQISIVDIAPLVLLILFFGIQQRQQKQIYYRFWFFGWIFVLLSYAMWALKEDLLPQRHYLIEFLRVDFLLLAALIFMLSFLTNQRMLTRVVLMGLPIAIPTVLIMPLGCDYPQFAPKWLLTTLVFAWEAYGIYAAKVLLPVRWRRRRISICLLCLLFCILLPADIYWNNGQDLSQWAMAELLVCAALLYRLNQGRPTLAGVMGLIGYVCWGVFYVIGQALQNMPIALHALSSVWNLPKYFVAFSMILRIFEDHKLEQETLAKQFQTLYLDFRVLFQNHPQPMWIYEAATGQFLSANGAAVHDYGYSAKELLSMKESHLSAMDEHDISVVQKLFPDTTGQILRHRHKDGTRVWVSVEENDIQFQGREARLMQAQNISDRFEAVQRLEHRAHHDKLTGLPNRQMLDDRIEQALARCERDGKKMALLSIDIDHFKKINDTHGHLVGDACLRAVATRLQTKIRSIDTLARTGGEEFIAIVGGLTKPSDAEKIADGLLHLFADPVLIPECRLTVSISIGVAIYPDDADDAETLHKRSDEALYQAKRLGRNRVVLAERETVRG